MERVALLARSARTRRCCLADLAGLAVTLGLRELVRPGLMGLRALLVRAMVAWAARVAPAAWAAMLELAALEELAVPGLAATVVWA